jgi:hypothetical protein
LKEVHQADAQIGSAAAYTGQFRFADLSGVPDSETDNTWWNAKQELDSMLAGKEPLSLRRAVFVSEHPVLGDRISYAQFCGVLDRLAGIVNNAIRHEGLEPSDPLVKHYGIEKLFQDTLIDPVTGKKLPPLRYDFEDFYGDTDMAQLTVGKLLLTGEGQCRSMPLLYLLMAEQLGTEAFWAFAPNHSYVKFRDAQGQFHNFETTNGHFASDAWIMASGYVKANAVAQRSYLDTVGTRRAVAHLLADLAVDYQYRFGFDARFMEPCLQEALDVFPTDIHAMMELSNLRTAYFDRAAFAAGYPPLSELDRTDPALADKLSELRKLYAKVDAMGFAEMPVDVYARWLKSVDVEKRKREEETVHQKIGLPMAK